MKTSKNKKSTAKTTLHLLITLVTLGVYLPGFGQNTFPSSGNVGIGTTSPSSELEVKSAANNDAEIHINAESNGDQSIIRFQDASQNTWGFLSNYPHDGKFSFFNYQKYDNAIVIDANSRVGIGSNSPSSELEIKSVANNDAGIHINAGSNGDQSLIRFQDAGESTWGFLSNYPHDGKFSFFNYQKYDNAIVIDANSRVGIGTNNPTDPLTVNGKIKAEEIEVVVDVPADYVFEEDYALKSLTEVEDFITKEGHLPDIPSAEEIKSEGWEVGEMSNKLLQKIEELTLYMIELKKESQRMQLENTRLKERIDILEAEK